MRIAAGEAVREDTPTGAVDLADSWDGSYEPFTLEPEYGALNRAFIQTIPLTDGQFVVDIACGIGLMGEMIRERDPSVRLLALDLDADAIAASRARAISHSATCHLRAAAEQLPLTEACAGGVLIGNAIQLFDPIDNAIREARRVVRRDGWLAFNTSFFAGTFVPGTERFYRAWIEEALRLIKLWDHERRTSGHSGIARRRGTVARAFSRPWLRPEEYERKLMDNGFRIESSTLRTVMLSKRSFEAIGSYAGLATVLLSGYPAEIACRALTAAAAPAVATTGQASLPRYWLEVVARPT
jgi:ubiquinone/menaquinone biosynthesis C-methylase UbiE